MNNVLQVWLAGQHLGTLERLRNGRARLRFSTEAITRFGVGSRVLSFSLAITPRRVEGSALDRFLEGLLPEPPLRQTIERQHGIRPGDSFALLRAIGLECAGAIQFTAGDREPGIGRLRSLSIEEASRIVRDLPAVSSPDGLPISASLGGVQAKVLLTKTDAGWAWPTEGAISTHIIKPEPAVDIVVPNLIEAEEWALRLASAVGLPAAKALIEDFDGRKAIVVERYDRAGGKRRHQEDFTQALGVSPLEKYETSVTGERRLQRIARDAGAISINKDSFQCSLLRAVTFNLAIGNGDAHSKNYSLLIDHRTGIFSLAPIYDAAPVFLMNPAMSSAGHALGGKVDLKYLTLRDTVTEATSWGMTRDEAQQTVSDLVESIASAATEVEAPEALSAIPTRVRDRALKLLHEFEGP